MFHWELEQGAWFRDALQDGRGDSGELRGDADEMRGLGRKRDADITISLVKHGEVVLSFLIGKNPTKHWSGSNSSTVETMDARKVMFMNS